MPQKGPGLRFAEFGVSQAVYRCKRAAYPQQRPRLAYRSIVVPELLEYNCVMGGMENENTEIMQDFLFQAWSSWEEVRREEGVPFTADSYQSAL